MLNRVTVDFGGASQYGMSVEELLSDQRSRPDYSPALLEKIFEMGRHWFILNSGKYPSIAGEVNFTINLQTPGLEPADIRRGEETRPAARPSANGRRRAGRPPRRHGGLLQLDGEPGPGLPGQRQKHLRIPRHVVSALAATRDGRQVLLLQQLRDWRPLALLDFRRRLAYRPFWDHYLATGDLDFLRNRVVPA